MGRPTSTTYRLALPWCRCCCCLLLLLLLRLPLLLDSSRRPRPLAPVDFEGMDLGGGGGAVKSVSRSSVGAERIMGCRLHALGDCGGACMAR